MKKVELIKKWHEKIAENGISHSAARLEMLLESLCDTLSAELFEESLCDTLSAELFEGGEVSLPGIGKLKPVQVPGRDRLNPRTGEKVFVPAHLKVVFRPSKTFSERLN